MSDHSLIPFFHPRGVVVVGASSNPAKLGYGVARNLVNSGYQGGIHFVSQRPGNLFGRPVYTSISDIPAPVDLAVLIVPSPAVLDALRSCGRRGVKAAVIISSGFREAGPDGAALEFEALRIAREYDMRIIGPNCIGLLDTHLPLDTTFLPPPLPPTGDVAFISQSGAICAAIIDWARGRGFGFSRLISLGNQTDVNETDMLSAVVEDKHTHVLTLYLEGVANGHSFIKEARRVTRRKPVVALKVGRFASGKRAAESHTGALAGSEAAYNAAFERAGILRADTSEEMFDWALALASSPLPKGRCMAVLTHAGGPGVIATDALEIHGLTLAGLSPATQVALAQNLPPAASLHNPVDMTASASPETYAACLHLLLDDPGVDGVLLILLFPPMFSAETVADAIIPLIHASHKPVVVALMGENLILEAFKRFHLARVPTYPFPERAASALACLVERAEFLGKPEPAAVSLAGIDPQAVKPILRSSKRGGFLEPEAAYRLLASYGIPITPLKFARNEAEAAAFAAELGFPVAIKVASADISHKSDVGGVMLDIDSLDSAAEAFRLVTERARAAKPAARIEGATVQRMLPDGQEVIIGATRDPQFGALMMFGSGGVEVEGLKDVAFALAPLTAADAERMLARTWAGRKLYGYRNIPPVDAEAVKDVLLRLSQLVNDFPDTSEIEINPLRVMVKGAAVVDVRVLVLR